MSISVANSAMLLRFHIGGKTFLTTDKQLSQELTTSKEAARDAGKVVKSLLGGRCKELDAIQKIAAAARAGVVARTLPYHAGGYYIVSVQSWESTMKYVKDQEKLFNEALDAFIRAFPSLVEDAKTNLNKLLTGSEVYPTEDQLRSQFVFNYHLEPMPDSNLFDKVFDLNGQEQSLKDEMQSQMQNTLEEAVQTLKDRVLERIDCILERLVGDQRRTRYASIFRKTEQVMEVVNGLNITRDPRVGDWTRRVLAVINHDSEVVRKDPSLRNEMEYELNRVRNEMVGAYYTPQVEVVHNENENDDDHDEFDNASEADEIDEEVSTFDSYDEAIQGLIS